MNEISGVINGLVQGTSANCSCDDFLRLDAFCSGSTALLRPRSTSFQTFNQDDVVNPSAANEGESTFIGRERETRNLIVAQISDQLRTIVMVKRLAPEKTLRPIDGDIIKTPVVTHPGDSSLMECVVRQDKGPQYCSGLNRHSAQPGRCPKSKQRGRHRGWGSAHLRAAGQWYCALLGRERQWPDWRRHHRWESAQPSGRQRPRQRRSNRYRRHARQFSTCALLADGTARCWGANGSGQLGDGTNTPRLTPTIVSGFANGSIAVGESHMCALVAVGVPFCWGFNGSGRLGDGTLISRNLPTLVSLDNAVAVAGGNTHSCALRADGTAWCWGGNLLGQLGINNIVSQSAPRLVVNLSSAVAIAGGFGHTCALVANGGARCWGDNNVGQLGNGSSTASLTPTGVVSGLLALCVTGTRGCTSPQLNKTIAVTTGRRHSCALLATGGVSCWGENTFGQLGINSTDTFRTAPVSVPSFTLNIDPNVIFNHNSRVTTVTVVASCEAGQRLFFDVNLDQGAASGHGAGSGACTGALERYELTVPAQGRDPFLIGPAQVSAKVFIQDKGLIVDVQEWTRAVNIVNAP